MLNLVINSHGIVQRIDLTLSPEVFEFVVPELIAKFGPPTKTDRPQVQNRMGAKFEQIHHFWQGEGSAQLTFSKYAGTLERSRLYFSTKQDRELLGKSKASRAGDI